MAKVGTIIEGKYEILKEIGRGGMSIVYLARDTHLNKQWAVKEILKVGQKKKDRVIINSLLTEADLMKRLDHPALPRIVDIIEYSDTICVVMDYIEGESLDNILELYGPQEEKLVIGWAKQLCDVLDYLHSQKPPIIYRDMKPSNVMLKSEGNIIKIIDFGIAREYKESGKRDTTICVTEGYAPPEQYFGQTDVRSDIYALGMTMHHLLTGEEPKSGEECRPIREHNSELSAGLEYIIDKCVQRAPESRYQNCRELLYDLQNPNIIIVDYKKMQKRKLAVFAATAAAMVAFLVSGFVCNVSATQINNNNYETLISSSTAMALEEKVDSYKRAISIYPDKTEAYICLLEAYEDEGKFSKTENDQFLALYNANKDDFDPASEKTAELNYKTGMMYFNYYTNEDGSQSFANRVQKAYSFFQANYQNNELSPEFAYKELSDCYYHICDFYKKYILSAVTVEEASKENYEVLFSTIEGAIESVQNAGAYDQLTLYNATFMLLYDQRSNMAQVNIEQERIQSLLALVDNQAEDLLVQKEQSRKLQREITDHYGSYRDAITRVYANAEERE